MSIFFGDHKNIFELIKEDDGSDIINGGMDEPANNANAGGGDDNASSSTEDNNTDNANDDNFDIDTSLDNNDANANDNADDTNEESNDDNDSENDLDSNDSSSSSSSSIEGSGEAIPANKDLFPTLTAEEQAIKIREQKKQYDEMYIYIDDLIDKINNINLDEDNINIIQRISKNLYRLRTYLSEYIETIFNMKDYYENDVFFRRFLLVLYSIDTTILELSKSKAKKLGLNDEENDKK